MTTPAYGMTLLKEEMAYYIVGSTQGYRFRLTCQEVNGLPDTSVFLYLCKCASPSDLIVELTGVCSPADFVEFPIWDPLGLAVPGQFYRSDYVDLLFRSTDELQDTWRCIYADCNGCCQTYRRIADSSLTINEQVIISPDLPYASEPAPVYRAGILRGLGSNLYTIRFTPAFYAPPVFTATPVPVPSRRIIVELDGQATVSQAKIILSEPLLTSDSLNWIATGY